MKIGMQTWGSHGDVRPFLALAEGLQADGHQVTLLITCVDSDVYKDVVSPAGVTIRVVASPVVAPSEAERIGQLAFNTRNPMAQMATILKLCFDPAEDAMFAAAQQLCGEVDLLIGHYFMHPLQIAAEHAGRPYVSVLLSHAGVPSDYSHPLNWPLPGRRGNRLLWWLTRIALNRVLRPYANRWRRQLGMPLARDVVNEVWLTRPLTLLAVSPQICARQPDWPASIQVSGFLDMPNIALEGQLPDDLATFLAAGHAPVYMTMGSWMPGDVLLQRETLRVLSAAARQAGCRAIIQSPGWRDCGAESSADILYVSASPHHLIFPHCQAVVHHGGAGTTQSATLAGKPSVVVAHISEQEHWGNELRRLGIAAAPLHRRSLTVARLARQLAALQGRADMAARAQAVGAAMRQDQGVQRAVALIRQTFGGQQAAASL